MTLTIELTPEQQTQIRQQGEDAVRQMLETPSTVSMEVMAAFFLFLGLLWYLVRETGPLSPELEEVLTEALRLYRDDILKHGTAEQLAALLPKLPASSTGDSAASPDPIAEDLAGRPEDPSGALIEEYEGVAYIAGTRIKVRLIAEATNSGYSVQDLQEAYPQLALAQIYAALTYYYTHQEALDAEIARLQRMSESYFLVDQPPTREVLEERARQLGYVRTPEGLKKTA